MNEADFVICAVLLVSTVVGVSRGVVREILAIVGWAVAIFLALNYSPELARVIPLESLGTAVRTACAAVIIVVLTLLPAGFSGKSAQGFWRLRKSPLKTARSVRCLALQGASLSCAWRCFFWG